MSFITVEKVPIPVFGPEEVDREEYATRSLTLDAIFASKGFTDFWKTTKHADLPVTEDLVT